MATCRWRCGKSAGVTAVARGIAPVPDSAGAITARGHVMTHYFSTVITGLRMALGEKDLVLGDYAALLRMALPAVRGVHCYGGRGALIWGDERVRAGEAVLRAVRRLLANARTPLLPSRLDDAGHSVLLLPFSGEERPETCLGVLVVTLDVQAGDLSAEDCAQRVAPILHTLAREMGLRLRAVEAQRKLSVQAAEERLLHEIEQQTAATGDSALLLERIADACQRHLQVDSLVISLPEKAIELVRGERFVGGDGQQHGHDPVVPPIDTMRRGQWSDEDTLVVPLHCPGDGRTGMLGLAGWGRRSGFSQRRCMRIARYVASHIEAILSRDYDALTGLLTWPALEQRLEQMRLEPDADQHAMVYVDLDGLHVVNETLGRRVGDEILQSLATILREELAGGIIGRVAGDAFAALLPWADQRTARQQAEQVCRRIRAIEYRVAGSVCRASASIGIGPLAGGGAGAPGGPLATAQVACRAAKDRGRDRVEAYESADESIVRRLDDIQRVGHVREAIDRDRLVLLAQPIVATQGDARPRYWEVLVRLLDDDGRYIAPANFLSAAERYQLMEELDRWVVGTALDQIAPCRHQLAQAGARIAINLSGQSLGSEGFQEFIAGALADSGVPARLVCFEITESVAVANMQRAQALMHALKRLGCRFSLDDFGTGLSSFAYLKLFPVDTLKIDGSFIRDLVTNAVSQSVVAAISEVARVMQLDTVAEYVEDEATLSLLARLGITWAQGFHLGHPQPLAEVLAGAAIRRSGPTGNDATVERHAGHGLRRP